MRIGVDLDGVCYNFTNSLRKFLVEHKGVDARTLPETTCWDFFSVDWGLTLEEYLTYAAEGVDAEVVFLDGPAHTGCKSVLDTLHEDGHTIHIVTHRFFGQKSVSNTEKWLRREKIPFDTLTFAKDKTVVPVDIFIEDNVENAVALRDAGTECWIIDRPWNQHDPAGDDYRVLDWWEFGDVVDCKVVESFQNTNTDETVLDEAKRLVYGNRNADYGHPYDDYKRTAAMWSALFGTEITPQQAILGMIAVKLSRLANDHTKRDSVVDVAGYAECLSRVNRRGAGLE